jgi:agmatine/peptidylarginine deiminase
VFLVVDQLTRQKPVLVFVPREKIKRQRSRSPSAKVEVKNEESEDDFRSLSGINFEIKEEGVKGEKQRGAEKLAAKQIEKESIATKAFSVI